jgi:hypothetical protein
MNINVNIIKFFILKKEALIEMKKIRKKGSPQAA